MKISQERVGQKVYLGDEQRRYVIRGWSRGVLRECVKRCMIGHTKRVYWHDLLIGCITLSLPAPPPFIPLIATNLSTEKLLVTKSLMGVYGPLRGRFWYKNEYRLTKIGTIIRKYSKVDGVGIERVSERVSGRDLSGVWESKWSERMSTDREGVLRR